MLLILILSICVCQFSCLFDEADVSKEWVKLIPVFQSLTEEQNDIIIVILKIFLW